jgi:argininosuccinate synthase
MKTTNTNKVLLAYSGGLDTSTILQWLIEKGYEVVCYVADVGQKDDFDSVKTKALQNGAKEVYIDDLKEEFLKDCVLPALKANAKYEGEYLLGTALARPLIAKKQIELAQKLGIDTVSHGATGKGNDQVRFELTYYQFYPEVKVIAPWKDEEFLNKFQGRLDMMTYCKEKGIEIEATIKKPYSMDENLLHTSYESGMLEEIWEEKDYNEIVKDFNLPKDAPDKIYKLKIKFENGIPTEVIDFQTEKTYHGLLNIFNFLNKIGSQNGIGMIDIVESRFVGMKSRGIYITPAGTLLWKAHKHLEMITLDKEVINLKEMFTPKYCQIIYNGFWFAPEMEAMNAFMESTQKYVNGEVKLNLYKGNITVVGTKSDNSLYSSETVSMDVHGDYDQKDADGFIIINALRLKKYTLANKFGGEK